MSRNFAAGLLNALSGSITLPLTPYWIENFSDIESGKWRDTTTQKDNFHGAESEYGHMVRHQIHNEWSFFFKDDFKVTERLTLNLGVRYDWLGSPYLANGLTSRFEGDGQGLFGVSSSIRLTDQYSRVLRCSTDG